MNNYGGPILDRSCVSSPKRTTAVHGDRLTDELEPFGCFAFEELEAGRAILEAHTPAAKKQQRLEEQEAKPLGSYRTT